jgi:E3 ubiquitin-protein ligase NEDD4
VSVFNPDEIEAAICGSQHIDLEDWKKHTDIKGYGAWSQTIKRFWKIMEGYTQQELSRILQFCTGTSRLPLGGFRSLESHRGEKARFCIQRVTFDATKGGVMSNLPKAHTCFNRLDLPRYSSYEDLKVAMDFIAKNDIVGFGLEE